jgi:hypothetical protein
MSKIQNCLWAAMALAAAIMIAPETASARGPIRRVVGRPVVRAPVAVVRTARVVTLPYVPYYYAPRVYVSPPVYFTPVAGTVIYLQ